MYVLLPEEEKKRLKREYKFRFTAVFMYVLGVSSLIGVGSVAPAYILSYVDEREADAQLKVIERDREDRGSAGLDEEINETKRLISLLTDNSSGINPIALSNIVDDLIRPRGTGVRISSISLSTQASSTVDVTISGVANTREVLVSYRRRLAEDPRISKVDLPVSDLAKSSDISFNLSISILP
jgi:hypothetical protein